MERWVLLRKGADFEAISKKFHISPRLASLIRNRDVIVDEAINQYLNGTIVELYDGMQMKGMPQAVEILTPYEGLNNDPVGSSAEAKQAMIDAISQVAYGQLSTSEAAQQILTLYKDL